MFSFIDLILMSDLANIDRVIEKLINMTPAKGFASDLVLLLRDAGFGLKAFIA